MVYSVQPRFIGIPYGEGRLVEVGTGNGGTGRLAFGVMSLGCSTRRHKAAVSWMRRQAKVLQEDMDMLEPEDDESEQDDEA
jgi:hypothetical protein